MSAIDNDELSPEEERRVWKKNSELLYDFGLTVPLKWSTLTTQWLPQTRDLSPFASSHSLLMGTQSDGVEGHRNSLLVAEIALPKTDTVLQFDEHFDRAKHGFGRVLGKAQPGFQLGTKPVIKEKTFNIIQRIVHDGDVHRARFMPQNAVSR
jgi:histone-binding protein RBBP4